MRRDEDSRWFDSSFLYSLSKEQAATLIENAVYDTCHLFERLEGVGKVHGNGHHMMQLVAKVAGDLMRDRWNETVISVSPKRSSNHDTN
jgi:hypothetical protein